MKSETELKIVNGTTGQPAAPEKPRTGKGAKQSPRTKPVKTLPTSRITLEKQLNVLRACAAASGRENKPFFLDEAADIVKMPKTSLYLMTPFFCEIGLLQRVDQQPGKYLPAEEVVNFSK